jgi:hypothetical protein
MCFDGVDTQPPRKRETQIALLRINFLPRALGGSPDFAVVRPEVLRKWVRPQAGATPAAAQAVYSGRFLRNSFRAGVTSREAHPLRQ